MDTLCLQFYWKILYERYVLVNEISQDGFIASVILGYYLDR